MKLMIDNLDGQGPLDYTAFLDAGKDPRVVRKLNRPTEFQSSLVASAADFVPPAPGARITLARRDGSYIFTGYVVNAPECQYEGAAQSGPLYRYRVSARSDEMMLDQKATPFIPPFIARSAGGMLKQLSQEMLPGWLDLTRVEDGDVIPYYLLSQAKKWSVSAGEIALLARCAFRSEADQLVFAPMGKMTYPLTEHGAELSPGELTLIRTSRVVNDITVFGEIEPNAHVKDYFVGDGLTTKFYLSEKPFTRGTTLAGNRTILNDEYVELDPTHWVVTDPGGAITVSGGELHVAGGTGVDGQTLLSFIEKMELGGAVEIEHGDFVFNAATTGVIGGLYPATISVAGCWAGFLVTASGASTQIQALIGGTLTGTALATQAGHHYVFTTRLYANEMYRMQQVFHSSQHPAGNAWGGNPNASDVRVVLEVHDLDPSNPATQIAPAIVLYDGVMAGAPGFCTYSLINAAMMQCSVAFTGIFLPVDATVRSTLPGQDTRTRRAGSLLDGAECRVSEEPALQFYPEYVPAMNETIEVTYRGQGRAMARVVDSASIVAHRFGNDDGVRGNVHLIKLPTARTSVDCETAALALLDDAGSGWLGDYKVWSSFLPGGAKDIFPGDCMAVDVPSQGASFTAVVNEVGIVVVDITGEHSQYTLGFVDSGSPALDFTFETATAVQHVSALTAIDKSVVLTAYLPDLSSAAITTVTSTTVNIDAGITPVAGNGIEVRLTDAGWGAGNDRNLVGRFTSGTFTVPRYGRAQDYFLRSYDSNLPPRYSRYSAALHVDYPL